MASRSRSTTILAGFIFVLILAVIIYLYVQTTGRQLIRMVDEARDDRAVIEQLEDDFSTIGDNFDEAKDSFEQQRTYILNKAADDNATSTDPISSDIIEQLKLELENSYSTSTE